jgi:hypothetical protein
MLNCTTWYSSNYWASLQTVLLQNGGSWNACKPKRKLFKLSVQTGNQNFLEHVKKHYLYYFRLFILEPTVCETGSLYGKFVELNKFRFMTHYFQDPPLCCSTAKTYQLLLNCWATPQTAELLLKLMSYSTNCCAIPQTDELLLKLTSYSPNCWFTRQTAELLLKLLSYSSNWRATPQTAELLLKLISYSSTCWATPQPAELLQQILSYPSNCWALPHDDQLIHNLLSYTSSCLATTQHTALYIELLSKSLTR